MFDPTQDREDLAQPFESENTQQESETVTKTPILRISELCLLNNLVNDYGDLKKPEEIIALTTKERERKLELDLKSMDMIESLYLTYFLMARGEDPKAIFSEHQLQSIDEFEQASGLISYPHKLTQKEDLSKEVLKDELFQVLSSYAASKYGNQNPTDENTFRRHAVQVMSHIIKWFPSKSEDADYDDNPFLPNRLGIQNPNENENPLDPAKYTLMLPHYLRVYLAINDQASLIPVRTPMAFINKRENKIYGLDCFGSSEQTFENILKTILQNAALSFLFEQSNQKVLRTNKFQRGSLHANLEMLLNMYSTDTHLLNIGTGLNPKTGFFNHTHIKHNQVIAKQPKVIARFKQLIDIAIRHQPFLTQHRAEIIKSKNSQNDCLPKRKSHMHQGSLF